MVHLFGSVALNIHLNGQRTANPRNNLNRLAFAEQRDKLGEMLLNLKTGSVPRHAVRNRAGLHSQPDVVSGFHQVAVTLQRTKDLHEVSGVDSLPLKRFDESVLERQRIPGAVSSHGLYRRSLAILFVGPANDSKRSPVMLVEG